MKLLSLFTGIGAFEKALKNLNIPIEVVAFCEINEPAAKSYCAVHEEQLSKNLVDVSKVDWKLLKDQGVELITHGSPCQSFSISGKGEGGDRGSGTKSSLMWNTVEAIETLRPKWVVWENVKNLMGQKHRHNFEAYLNTLESFGYTNSWKVLNSKWFGSAQSRDRIFTVSSLEGKSVDLQFKDRKITKCFLDIKEHTDEGVLTVDPIIFEQLINKKSASKLEKLNMVGMYKAFGYEQSRRVYDESGLVPTLTTGCDTKFLVSYGDQNIVRRITALEAWLAMGFSKDDFEKASKVCSKGRLYHQAGNSIVVPVLEAIFSRMFF